MDPLLRLVPALYTALTETPLSYAGTDVPVRQSLNTAFRGHYVHLTQPTAATVSLNPNCRQWTCTAVLDIITQFAQGSVSSIPARTLSEQITSRLEGQRLPLPEGWDCGPATVEFNGQLPTEPGELLAVRIPLRLRWSVFYHAGAPILS